MDSATPNLDGPRGRRRPEWAAASILWLAAAALCLLSAGCVPRRIAWSPDGARAAVFAGDGLHLCGPDGALSELILPGEGLAEWFPDSRRLAVVSSVEKTSWKDMQEFLAPEERQRIVQEGKAVLDELKTGHSLDQAFSALPKLADNDKNAVEAYLAESEGTREQAGTNWEALQKAEAGMMQFRIGRLEKEKLTLGPPLLNRLRNICDLRVSPSGTAIAFTDQDDNDQGGCKLWVVPADGSAPPRLVSSNTALCADWSADGRSLVYIRALAEQQKFDDLALAALQRRGILNAAGGIEIQAAADDLAGLACSVNNKVRCLRNGWIIFAAADIHLPSARLDQNQPPQLFALDPETQDAPIPLIPAWVRDELSDKPVFHGTGPDLSSVHVLTYFPDKPCFYEPSPDGRRIAISSGKGGVVVLTLAKGSLETVQEDGSDDTLSAPVWRSSGELCFIAAGDKNGPAQVALWSHGTNRVLSAHWPPEARKSFLEK